MRATSTRAAQKLEVSVPGLRKERIVAAFGNTAPSTQTPQAESTLRTTQRDAEPRGIRLAPPTIGRLNGFVTEQRWQGYVLSVKDDTFFGRVFDTTPGFTEEIEEAEFSKGEVAELMRPLIVEGAVFFWDIGFETDAAGSRERRSVISFPMIPVDTKKSKEENEERARARFKELGWSKQNTSERGTTENTA